MGRPRKQPSIIYIATESFIANVDGVEERVTAGMTTVREGHPLLRGHEQSFTPMKVDYEIEQATAAPGERRGE